MDGDSQIEYDAAEADGPFPATSVCYRRGDQGANESTYGKLPKFSRCNTADRSQGDFTYQTNHKTESGTTS